MGHKMARHGVWVGSPAKWVMYRYILGIVEKLLIITKCEFLRMSWNPQQFLNDLE